MEQVYLAPCTEYQYEPLKQAVDDIFDHLALNRFLFQGANVVIKPNLLMKCNPDTAIITHPLLVAAVGTKVKELGGKVTIAESSGGRYTPSTVKNIYQACGYTNMAQQYGFLLNTDCSYRSLKAPNAIRCKEFQVISPILDADIIIDIGKLKTHCMTGMSGAVKNMFGVVPGLMKPELHCRFPDKKEFSEMLVDLCEAVRPHIAIMDAVMGMEGNGPTAGQNRHIGLVMASENAHALDLASCYLIDYAPNEVDTVREAIERGLVCDSAEKIDIAGEDIKPLVMKDYLKPESHFNLIKLISLPDALNARLINALASKPAMDYDICVGCGECARCCPPKAIDMSSGKPVIDTKRCIKCFCCQELCPKKAVKIKRPLLNRFMVKFLK